jgi:hypothetical protein
MQRGEALLDLVFLTGPILLVESANGSKKDNHNRYVWTSHVVKKVAIQLACRSNKRSLIISLYTMLLTTFLVHLVRILTLFCNSFHTKRNYVQVVVVTVVVAPILLSIHEHVLLLLDPSSSSSSSSK